MATVKKCDCCEKEFDYGFSITIKIQGIQEIANIAVDRFEIGDTDLCRDCYYKLKEIIEKNKGGD